MHQKESRIHRKKAHSRRGEAVSVDAPSVILMESSTGQILYEKNADEQSRPGQHHEDYDAAADF